MADGRVVAIIKMAPRSTWITKNNSVFIRITVWGIASWPAVVCVWALFTLEVCALPSLKNNLNWILTIKICKNAHCWRVDSAAKRYVAQWFCVEMVIYFWCSFFEGALAHWRLNALEGYRCCLVVVQTLFNNQIRRWLIWNWYSNKPDRSTMPKACVCNWFA